jgi:hypothetical protein
MRAARFLLAGAVLALAAAPLCEAAPPPLTAVEQEQINRAIERGVSYLKQAQHAHGGWAEARSPHAIGYVALPALTLLECGVAPSDRAVQRAARAVRRTAPFLDKTYELSLAVLFLDRLDDPRDRDLIQSLAVRLIAGQTATGGWGYKCPVVGRERQRQILIALRKLNPERPAFVVNRPPRPDVPGKDLPIARAPGDGRPADFPAGGKAPGGGAPDFPVEGRPGTRPGEPKETTQRGPERSIGDSVQPPREANKDPAPKPPAGADEARPVAGPDPRRWARCLKTSEWVDDSVAPDARAEGRKGRDGDGRADDAPPPKPAPLTVVPPGLRGMPVFQDPAWLVLRDPPNRSEQPLLATTDNSNTQFALLALWAAQRHDVPMQRSLHLMVRRFQTSQNANGSWGYRYVFGGGAPEGPAMTAVGLLGLAVGHGLAGKGEKNVRDPAILKGFVALGKHIGTPAGRMHGLPQPNLYLLWSIERVGVLYSLSEIAGKDWYRWGAEALVANQGELGEWNKGGYHGATPVCDTCLALLFLKRANLAKSLRDQLPFNPEDLEARINEASAPPGKTETSDEEAAARRKKNAKDDKAKKDAEDKARALAGALAPPDYPEERRGPSVAPSGPAPTPPGNGASTPAPSQTEPQRSSKRWLWFVLLALGAALMAGAVTCLVVHLRRGSDEPEPKKRSKKSGKKRAQPVPGKS